MTTDIPTNHGLVIDPERQGAHVDGQWVELGATEFRILQLLAGAPEQAFSRVQILDGIHDGLYAITPRAVDGQILSLRRKLGPAAPCIETIRGVGYRFRAIER